MCNEQPVSNLDERLDDLLRVLATHANPADWAAQLRTVEAYLQSVSIDSPLAVEALEVSALWGALAGVLDEVIALKAIPRGDR